MLCQVCRSFLESKVIKFTVEDDPSDPDENETSSTSYPDSGPDNDEKIDESEDGEAVSDEHPILALGARHTHHKTFDSLLRAVDRSCYICYRLWEALSASHELLRSRLGSDTQHRATEISVDVVSDKEIDIVVRLSKDDRRLLKKVMSAGPDRVSLKLGRSKDFAEVPFGNLPKTWDEALQLAPQWISTCQNSHKACQSRISEPSGTWKPTRLIDIDDPHFQRPNQSFRLVLGSSLPVTEAYCTLSHCWGKIKILRLTTGNMAEMCSREMPVSTLPTSFQDAIRVTRHLGARYIWIDSLCIIQEGDNLADWNREAPMMHKIYSNSFCTIAATSAADGSTGFLRENLRLPTIYHQSEVNLRLSISSGKRSRLGKLKPRLWTVYEPSEAMWLRELREQPLLQRGWVFQERILSKRLLHFSERQMIWECCEMDALECFPRGLQTQSHLSASPPRISDLVGIGFKSQFAAPIDDVSWTVGWDSSDNPPKMVFWFSVAEEYTRCLLTHDTDKMVALSGIAKQFKSTVGEDIGGDYVAGMWLGTIHIEAMWQVDLDDESEWRRPKDYLAPSWSWMSLPSKVPISWVRGWDEPMVSEIRCIQIFEDHQEKTNFDPTSHVCSRSAELWTRPAFGFMHMRGRLRQASLKFIEDSEEGEWELVTPGYNPAHRHSDEDMVVASLDYPAEAEEEIDATESRIYYWLEWAQSFLLVLELTDSKMSFYRRVGTAMLSISEKHDGLKVLRQSEEASIPCNQYNADEGLHTFFIV